jgi:hypothetical protein
VGIFGNSIARGVSDYAQEFPEVLERLKDLPAAANKRVVLLNFALGGQHQPQHLLILTHMLSVGVGIRRRHVFGSAADFGLGG